jgi:hypothetical protein
MLKSFGSYRARRNRDGDNYSDPSQPNYRPEWWRSSVRHWDDTLSWCGDLRDLDFKNYYLTTVPGELSDERVARLEATSPEPYFKDAVNDHTSIFTQFELAEDVPATLVEHQDNVDLQGADLWQWTQTPFKGFFRDGGCLMGCDIDRTVTLGQRRGRLLSIPLRDVYHVEYRDTAGVSVFSKVSIRRSITVKDVNSRLQLRDQYWVYELGKSEELPGCSVTIWEENENGKLIEGETTQLLAADGEPLTRLPFTDKLSVIGSLRMDIDDLIMSPFDDVLSLNIEHYNARSEFDTVKRKTALPTPIRYWENGVPQDVPPFYAGSGRTQDYSAGSRVEYLELRGESLPLLQADLDKIESKIERRNNKLFHAGSTNRSATEAEIENQKAKVGMPGIKMILESSIQDLFSIWELLANPSPGKVGGIIVDDTVLDAPTNAQDMMPYLQAIDRGIPTNAVTAAMIRKGLFTQEDFEGADIMPVDTLPLDEDEVIQ